eukprot:9627863-Alexandrium_andersonii.AAC.1
MCIRDRPGPPRPPGELALRWPLGLPSPLCPDVPLRKGHCPRRAAGCCCGPGPARPRQAHRKRRGGHSGALGKHEGRRHRRWLGPGAGGARR